MEVDCFMLADGAHAVEGKVYVLGGGWNTITALSFPAEHRCAITIGLRIGWNETNQPHNLEVNVLTEDRQPSQEIAKVQFETGRPPGLKPGSEQVFILAVNCALKLDEPRGLVMALSIDGELLKTIPFRIIGGTGPPKPE